MSPPPWVQDADWLEACDERGVCPDCGEPLADCDGHDDIDDTDNANFEPSEAK